MGTIAVGPESAGAAPGPICYGFGGARPTVTDANLVLGYLNPDYFNGGAMQLDAAAAAAGIARDIGRPLGLDTGQAAWGIHTVATRNMERAMRSSRRAGRRPAPLCAGRVRRRRSRCPQPASPSPLSCEGDRPARAVAAPGVGLLQADPRSRVSDARCWS